MFARTLILAIAGGLVSACSKTEPLPPAKPPTPKTAQAEPAAPPEPAKTGDIDDGLKERLARQEAAAKMFESKVLQPAPPKAPEPPPAVARSPEPAASRTQPAKAEPPKVAARVEPPKPEPSATPQSAPASPSAPRTDLAAARPAAAPEPQAATRLVTRVDPAFPREAAAAGVGEGTVKARMTLDAAGGVTRVEVLEANPRRVFDRAVVRALSQWRYNDGAAGRTVDMEIAFTSK